MTLGPQFGNYLSKFRSKSAFIAKGDPFTRKQAITRDTNVFGITQNRGERGTQKYEFLPKKPLNRYADEEVGAYLDVYHYPGQSTTLYPENYYHNEDWARLMAEDDGQIPLFTHTETKPYSEVDAMRSKKENRRDAMNLIGVAALDTMMKYGRELSPPNSLSRHSEKLVRSLDDAGLTQAPGQMKSNDWDFNDSTIHALTKPSDTMDPEIVRGGIRVTRNLARARLNRKRERTNKVDQTEQLRLDLD